MTVTLKFQSSGTMPGDARPVTMQGGSMTVGRGPANDMVLPDPDRLLSKNHFVIEDHNGNVVVVDLSTNGTFLNYSKIPLGRTPTPLNNGDVLTVGNYELVVQIAGTVPDFDDLIAPPAAAGGISHGDASRAPDPLDLLDAPGPGGDFLDSLLGPESKPTGPSQFNPVDPIDELLPPMGEEEDPFFHKTSDGREGEGASLPSHSAGIHDSYRSGASGGGQNLIPDDWDDLLGGPGASDPFAPPPSSAPPSAPPPPRATEPPPPSPPPQVPTPPRRTPPTIPPVAPPPEPEPEPEARDEKPIDPFATTAPPVRPQAPPPPARPEVKVAPAAPADPAASAEIFADFLRGARAEDLRIDPADQGPTLARMGRVMRMLITGLREILMTRTSIKSEFRIEQTMIAAGGNNPLKFSISPEQAVEAMIKPATRGYLSPESAAEQALQDIKAHEIAMVTGMEAALKGVLKRLDPKVLEGQIEASGGLGGLFKGKKARYWEVYEKIYAEVSDQAENDFHDLFSREFARAYKDQLDKLKQ